MFALCACLCVYLFIYQTSNLFSRFYYNNQSLNNLCSTGLQPTPGNPGEYPGLVFGPWEEKHTAERGHIYSKRTEKGLDSNSQYHSQETGVLPRIPLNRATLPCCIAFNHNTLLETCYSFIYI